MKKRLVIVLLLFATIYVGTWLVYGEDSLLHRDVRLVWTDWDMQTYAPEAPLFLCTNLTVSPEVNHNGRTAKVLTWDECQQEGRFASLQERVDSIAEDPNAGNGIVIAYAVGEVRTPFLTRNGVGYWFYETDHIETCDEWAVWGFTRWFVLYETNGSVCALTLQRAV